MSVDKAKKAEQDKIGREAASVVMELGAVLPAATVQKIYDDVLFELASKTKLKSKFRPAPRPTADDGGESAA